MRIKRAIMSKYMLGASILFLFLCDIQNAEKLLNLRSQTNTLENKDPVIALT